MYDSLRPGTNICYAISGARDRGTGVAAFTGGLRAFRAIPSMQQARAGLVRMSVFATIILTALKFNPDIRCVATIRYTDAVGRILEDMFLECCTIDSRMRSPGVSTMDWGVASCCKEGVPEAIVDPGISKSASVVHLFGEKPANVAGNIIMLSNRIIRIEL